MGDDVLLQSRSSRFKRSRRGEPGEGVSTAGGGDAEGICSRIFSARLSKRNIGEDDLSIGWRANSDCASGEVVAVDVIFRGGADHGFEATIEDGTAGKLGLMWFNSAFLRKDIHPGKFIRVQGLVRVFHGIPQMIQPKWETIEPTSWSAWPGGEVSGQFIRRR